MTKIWLPDQDRINNQYEKNKYMPTTNRLQPLIESTNRSGSPKANYRYEHHTASKWIYVRMIASKWHELYFVSSSWKVISDK